MRCPTLAKLPPPPAGKTGWPWTEESQSMPDVKPDGSPWPRVSIVTPSYNQGQFIEETIRSVLLQGYPDLEYIIMDGGSTDESVAIIKKYEPWLAYWVSEKDRGQTHAINKGFGKTTGEILAYLNSDDIYMLHALRIIADVFLNHSDTQIVHTNGYVTDEHSMVSGRYMSRPVSLASLLREDYICQPAAFFHSDLFEAQGLFREELRYVMDYDYWLRAAIAGVKFQYLDTTLAGLRLWAGCKSRDQELSMAMEAVDHHRALAALPSAQVWPITWWKDGLASFLIQLAWSCINAQQLEDALRSIKEAIEQSPCWVEAHADTIGAAHSKILVTRYGLANEQTLARYLVQLNDFGSVGARLSRCLTAWTSARLTEAFYLEGNQKMAKTHSVRALLLRPSFVRDRYYARLLIGALLAIPKPSIWPASN